jgi:hypothetical protein
VDGDKSLVIKNVVPSDEGVYVCEAQNSVGQITSKAQLVVNCEYPKLLFFAAFSFSPSRKPCLWSRVSSLNFEAFVQRRHVSTIKSSSEFDRITISARYRLLMVINKASTSCRFPLSVCREKFRFIISQL